MDYGDVGFRETLRAIVEATHAHELSCGIHYSFCGDLERAREWMDLGFDFMIYQSDLYFVRSGLEAGLAEIRSCRPDASVRRSSGG